MRRMIGGLRPPLTRARRYGCGPGPGSFIDRLPEPDGLPNWISQDELDRYIGEFSDRVHRGLNWYRNLDRNWETTAELTDARITVPSLFIAGTADPVLASPCRPCVGGNLRPVPSGDDRRRGALDTAERPNESRGAVGLPRRLELR